MMKKYICYILPVFLLLPILGALGVWSQKNNMQIGLRKTADGEFDVTGDPSAIKNLSYQFMVTDYLNVWQVTGCFLLIGLSPLIYSLSVRRV